MYPRTRLAVTAIALLAFVAAGCGEPSARERVTNRTEALSLLSPELRDRLDKQTQAMKTACENEIRDFLDSVHRLASRYAGLSYAEYSSKVAEIQVAYDKVDPGSLTGACLDAAAAAKKALNHLISAWIHRWMSFGVDSLVGGAAGWVAAGPWGG